MRQSISGFIVALIPIIFIITLILLFAGSAGWHILFKKDTAYRKTSMANMQQDAIEGQTVTGTGIVTAIGKATKDKDSPLTYDVRTSDSKKVIVNVSSREELCYGNSSKTNNLRVGSKVQVQGTLSNDGTLTVCKAGTYLRSTQ